jgi:hypothetical protein
MTDLVAERIPARVRQQGESHFRPRNGSHVNKLLARTSFSARLGSITMADSTLQIRATLLGRATPKEFVPSSATLRAERRVQPPF